MRLMRVSGPEIWGLNPFDRLSQLGQEINRLLEGGPGQPARPGEHFTGWAPALDLLEDQENLVARVELPGIDRRDLNVAVHEGVLNISGERKREAVADAEDCYRRERYHGRFHRSVTLPKPVKLDAIKASYKDGLLTVTLPKTEEARPRQINVSVG